MSLFKWAFLLAIFWLLLSGFLQPLLLTFGVITVALTLVLVKRMRMLDSKAKHFGSELSLLRYIPWVLSQIMLSSLQVTKHVWTRNPKFKPVLAKIPSDAIPKNKQVLYANSITLTPGTLCVDIDETSVSVHALEEESIKALQDGEIADKIVQLWGENKK